MPRITSALLAAGATIRITLASHVPARPRRSLPNQRPRRPTRTTIVHADETDLPPEVSAAVVRLDHLIKRFEAHPDPVVRDLVFELLSAVDAVHRAGLRRRNELLKVAGLQHRATDDPEVRLLFDLYDLGEGGDEARSAAVVQSVKPGLDAMGVHIELVESTATMMPPRLEGQPVGPVSDLPAGVCPPWSSATSGC